MFQRQLLFNEKFFEDRGLDLHELSLEDRVRWSKEWIIHLEREIYEFLDETDWKMYRSSAGSVVDSNLLEEWIDTFKYLLGLVQIWGFDEYKIVREFARKSSVVEYRYSMEKRLNRVRLSGEKVVGVDVDGVLNDYPDCFLQWVEFEEGIYASNLKILKEKVGYRRYLDLKCEYRESGEKVNQIVEDGAKEFLSELRSLGFAVVALSKRPYWRYHRIYADTLEWFEKNELEVDAILFHPEKHRKIVEDFPNLVAMVEDDPNVAREVVTIGIPVALIDKELNRGVEVFGARRFLDFRGILEWIEGMN